MTVMSDHVHTIPAGETHTTDRLSCRCLPSYYRMCQPCDGAPGTSDCYQCGGRGWVRIQLAEAEARSAADEALHIIHREYWRA